MTLFVPLSGTPFVAPTSAVAAMFEITLFAGDSTAIVLPMRDATTGAPIDLSGCSIEWALARAPGQSPLVSKSSSAGEVDASEAGTITIDRAEADTIGLHGFYYHEVEVTDSAGKIATVLWGRVRMKATSA